MDGYSSDNSPTLNTDGLNALANAADQIPDASLVADGVPSNCTTPGNADETAPEPPVGRKRSPSPKTPVKQSSPTPSMVRGFPEPPVPQALPEPAVQKWSPSTERLSYLSSAGEGSSAQADPDATLPFTGPAAQELEDGELDMEEDEPLPVLYLMSPYGQSGVDHAIPVHSPTIQTGYCGPIGVAIGPESPCILRVLLPELNHIQVIVKQATGKKRAVFVKWENALENHPDQLNQYIQDDIKIEQRLLRLYASNGVVEGIFNPHSRTFLSDVLSRPIDSSRYGFADVSILLQRSYYSAETRLGRAPSRASLCLTLFKEVEPENVGPGYTRVLSCGSQQFNSVGCDNGQHKHAVVFGVVVRKGTDDIPLYRRVVFNESIPKEICESEEYEALVEKGKALSKDHKLLTAWIKKDDKRIEALRMKCFNVGYQCDWKVPK